MIPNNQIQGSGCGSVGRAVTLKDRGPQFESSHRQKFILNISFRQAMGCDLVK